MKIAILGSRGIPNQYGGFEQFAEYLSVGLAQRGHEVTVYSSHTHPYKENSYKEVRIKHIFDPEFKIGTAGQFVYDWLCIKDTRKIKYDIILQLGYTSSSVSFSLHPRHSVVITNMDGLEWKRSKYGKRTQYFLKWAEALAVKKSDYLISDSIGIKHYLHNQYNEVSKYIPYGSHAIIDFDESVLSKFNVKKHQYEMLIARLEPENSIEIILGGVVASKLNRTFLVIGKHQTKYGQYLKNKFKNNLNIQFVGAVYDINKLNSLRFFANIYFHGHTVGGTNPSLLEAMGSSALICANDNEFNRTILDEDALYFKDSDGVKNVLLNTQRKNHTNAIKRNQEKIKSLYKWEIIIDQYESFFSKCLSNKTH